MISESGAVLKVEEHIITSNLWEFYILADEEGDDQTAVRFALVMGDYTELGGQLTVFELPGDVASNAPATEPKPAAGETKG